MSSVSSEVFMVKNQEIYDDIMYSALLYSAIWYDVDKFIRNVSVKH